MYRICISKPSDIFNIMSDNSEQIVVDHQSDNKLEVCLKGVGKFYREK